MKCLTVNPHLPINYYGNDTSWHPPFINHPPGKDQNAACNSIQYNTILTLFHYVNHLPRKYFPVQNKKQKGNRTFILITTVHLKIFIIIFTSIFITKSKFQQIIILSGFDSPLVWTSFYWNIMKATLKNINCILIPAKRINLLPQLQRPS